MVHYDFKDKIVYCNCDDPYHSNFFHFFFYNFKKLGLKKLITTCYQNNTKDFNQGNSRHAIYLEYDGNEEIIIEELRGNGDFRSDECIEILKKTDIVVTNPPFSLFREYVAQLVEYNKQFIIMGNINAVTYKEIFPLIMNDKIWFGSNNLSGNLEFGVPKHYPFEGTKCRIDENGNKFINVSGIRWFTNLNHKKRLESLILTKSYNSKEYSKLDNYDAININKTKDIPYDYNGLMAVPITFLDKWNPNDFKIIGITTSWSDAKTKIYPRQIKIEKNGKRSNVIDLNNAPAIKIPFPPSEKIYYIIDNNYYIAIYARILIKKIS